MVKALMKGVVGALLLGGVAFAQTPDPAKVAAGEKVYADQKCATCHQIKGVGSKISPLDGVGTKLAAADLRKWFTNPADMEAKLAKKPIASMAGYLKTHKLADADIDALVAYMQSLK